MNHFKRYLTRRRGARGVRLRRKHPPWWLHEAIERSPTVKAGITVIAFAGALCILLSGRITAREPVDLYVGQPAPRDVFADAAFTCENREETDKMRREAAELVPPHYSFSPEKLRECAAQIREYLGTPAEALRGAQGGKAPAAQDHLSAGMAEGLEVLAKTPEAARLGKQMEDVLTSLGGGGASVLREAEQAVQREGAPQVGERHRTALLKIAGDGIELWAAEIFPRDRRLREALGAVMNLCCGRSIEYDERLTQRMKDRQAARVAPVISRVQRGTKLIERGYEVTPKQFEVYSAYVARRIADEPEALRMRGQLYYGLGMALLLVMLLIMSRRYLTYYQPVVYRSNSALFMLEIIILGALLLSRGISYIPFGTIMSAWSNIFYYLMVVSVPMAAILMTLLLNRHLALFFAMLAALLVGVMKGFSISSVIVGVIGGMVAVYSAVGIRRRTHLVKAGMTIALANIITIGALDATRNINIISATAGYHAAGGFLTGMLAAFLAASFLPILESAFNVVTDIRLLELSDLNHPLLKRLFIEAPGTYHHSLMTGTLAEAAAEAVGANPLQVRVCAYFHDIGKLKKPQYFIENQIYGRSKHDYLNPRMSNLIIISHVKDGVDMAVTAKLNRTIVDAIREHHGTGLVYFFYRRAEEAKEEGEEVAPEDFRYPGPKPQSKETAIILLADAVEAASRSLRRPTPARIRNLVRNIINQRIMDGQMEECALTFNDLRLIAEQFEHVLTSTFHTRVSYPEIQLETGETA